MLRIDANGGSMFLTPAQYVITIFGSVRKTAKAIGRTPGAVINWKRSIARGGNGGNIPGPSQIIIMRLAKENNLDITSDDLLIGREVNNI